MPERKPVKFTFVYAKSPREACGWWLKISNMAELEAYIMKTHANPRIENAFDMYKEMHDKGQESRPGKSVREVLEELPQEERMRLMLQSPSAWNTMYGAIMEAERIGGTILDGFRCMNMEIGRTYIRHVREDGVCFINRNGGCNAIIEYDDWCTRDDLVWPDFTESDIRVKQFPGGEHWYAYVGSMEVHNGDTLRFGSKREAENAAMEIIRES